MVGPPGLDRGRLALGPADKKRSQVYGVSYEENLYAFDEWWAHLDLNQGPADYESDALTN